MEFQRIAGDVESRVDILDALDAGDRVGDAGRDLVKGVWSSL
jgi:hypothetical protein